MRQRGDRRDASGNGAARVWNSQTVILKRRIWPALLSVIFWLFYFVAGTIAAVTRIRDYAQMYAYTDKQFYSELYASVSKVIGLRMPAYYFTVALAVLLAVQGYSYLDSRQKIDFYESQPVSRKERFRGIYLNSILLFTVPYLISMLLGILVGTGMGAMQPVIVAETFVEFLRMLVLFLGAYSISVLAVMLTGNVIVACLGAAVLLVYEWAFSYEIVRYSGRYFHTFYSNGRNAGPLLSPVFNYTYVLSLQYASDIPDNVDMYGAMTPKMLQALMKICLPKDLITLAVFAAVTFLAYRCYCLRKNESAGQAVVFPAVRVIIKIALAVLGALVVGDILASIFNESRSTAATAILVLGMIFGAAAVCCVVEILYNFNFRSAFRGAWQIVIAVAASLLIFVTFRNDLTGYDRYIPKASDVSSCALFTYDYTTDYYGNSGTMIGDSAEFYRRYMKLTNVTDVEAVARLAQAFTVDQYNSSLSASGTSSGSSTDSYQAAVLYRMKDGRCIYRAFQIPADIDAAKMDAVTDTEEYRKGFFMIYHDEGLLENMKQKTLQLTYSAGYSSRNASGSTYADFKAAYEKDIQNYSYSMASTSSLIGTLTLSGENAASDGASSQVMYPVYPGYANTIAYLKKADLWVEPQLSSDDVQSITVVNSHSEVYADNANYQGDPSVAVDYTDSGSINAILKASYSTSLSGDWKSATASDPNYSIQITLKSTHKTGTAIGEARDKSVSMSGGYSDNTVYYVFYTGKVPDFVASDTAIQ
jgi:ABC-2 type transport system permease protein